MISNQKDKQRLQEECKYFGVNYDAIDDYWRGLE